MNVLVGTKSLLGEGWDSPCINSLILASFVGSFVLSNQMRGRAIRVMKDNPDKTSNIWHLVCMNSENTASVRKDSDNLSEDFLTLERRMQGFLGLSYTSDTIENGMSRLNCIAPPYTRQHITQINEQMCRMSSERDSLKKRWEEALVQADRMEVTDQCEIPEQKLQPGAFFKNLRFRSIFFVLLIVLAACAYFLLRHALKERPMLSFFLLIIMALGIIKILKYGTGLLRIFTPLRRLESIGKAVLYALRQNGDITSPNVKAVAEEKADNGIFTYLKGGTTKEKELYAECMQQFFAAVDNQRYLLCAPHCPAPLLRYFCVPDIFAKTKESAALFQHALLKYIGNYNLIYTRNPAGRKILLRARSEAFSNKNEGLIGKDAERHKIVNSRRS